MEYYCNRHIAISYTLKPDPSEIEENKLTILLVQMCIITVIMEGHCLLEEWSIPYQLRILFAKEWRLLCRARA